MCEKSWRGEGPSYLNNKKKAPLRFTPSNLAAKIRPAQSGGEADGVPLDGCRGGGENCPHVDVEAIHDEELFAWGHTMGENL